MFGYSVGLLLSWMLQNSQCERPYELGGKQKRHMPSRQTQLLQIAAELLQDTLSSHHQTTGTSGHLYLVLIPTRLGVPFQYLQPVPFYAFEISGRCPRSSAKVLARCIDNHSRRLRFTCRTHHRQFRVLLSLYLFQWQHDEAGSEPLQLKQTLIHWLSPQSSSRSGLWSRHRILTNLRFSSQAVQ